MEIQQSEQLHGQPLEKVSNLGQLCLDAEIKAEKGFESNSKEIELKCVGQCYRIQQINGTQLVKAPEGAVAQDAGLTVRDAGGMVDVEVKFGTMSNRKRGRPPRASQVKPKKRQPPPSQRRKKEEEDVCFICFDGGSLVLCDRRGCPKAYHPSCIKRDEAFFRSKAKWNCGWHICSTCRKSSHYVCYTCTYSLCKGCIKDADYFCVRENKGLCAACMKTIMMMENSALRNQGSEQVDFDDQTSWEYLFKVYWVCLKEKLNLTLDELTQAKNPWNVPSINSLKGKCSVEVDRSFLMASKCESSGDVIAPHINRCASSENSSGNAEANHAKRRKTENLLEFLNKPDSLSTEKSGGDEGTSPHEVPKWATDSLLEFVAFMKNGDTSKITPPEVHDLLQEYVKKNNLHDPNQQCLVVCDSRLRGLLGRERVDHIEMLGILKAHFLDQETRQTMIGVADAFASQMENDTENDDQLISENVNRRKTCKSNKEAIMDPNGYAAIDVHNINLVYLKRNFAEKLIDESDNFREKVVGSIVRIKINGTDPKQDMHRLVRVTGTTKAAEPYVIGDRKTDLMIEVQDLKKSDLLPIDAISNEEFSEDECRRLRQSIKCGLMKHFTVGEILERALKLQSQRIDDLLEAQKLQHIHLRDQASEKGHENEVRECVENLELLSSPDTHKHRLLGVEVVHIDPHMDPSYEAEDDVGDFVNPKSVSGVASGKLLTSNSVGIMQPSFLKKENAWYYEDPNGKSQGPFSIAQLRKWNNSGYFPVTLRVWRTDQKQDDSMLLTDALNGGFDKASESRMNIGICCDQQAFGEGHANNQVHSKGTKVPSSEENCTLPHVHSASNGWDSNTSFVALLNSCEIADQAEKSQLVKENQGCEMRLDGGETKLGHSFEQNSRSPPIDSCINGWDNTALVNFVKVFELIDQNQEVEFSDLPSSTANQSHVLGEDSEMKKPRCTASSPVAGGPQLPDVAGKWSGYSPSPAKPPLDKRESDVVVASIGKQTEVPNDHAATPTSVPSDHSSSSHPASNASSWQPAVVAELEEFTAWSEESVSELLAEVDEAMRSLNGVASPTSPLHCGAENDCFSPLRGLSSRPDTGRSTSLSPGTDIQIISRSPVNEEPQGISQGDVLDLQKSSVGRSSTSNEVGILEEVSKPPSDDSVNQCEAASNFSPPLPPVTSWEMATMDTTWRSGTETTNISEGALQGNADLGFRGLFQGIMNDDLITNQWGNLGIWGSQPRYSPRDFHVDSMDSSFGSGRPVLNGQPTYDDGNGGGKIMDHDGNGGASFGLTPKGQQVYKFDGNGFHKDGTSSSSYFHP
ncbi:zinc finger CCCH domain-containing protein 44 isoform X2 [Mangifera indica]|uniref:zinc finger CCCH domain-containing protein 44 isoform X2 n=1 Tax=Mangifera indica TaxID=29780 RepID=UPI001CFB087C|nr:zinc finger CCCH domain-containing protein 44 isoform X2 [Mangifera indica]